MHRLLSVSFSLLALLMASPGLSRAQMGLRSAPITAPREGILGGEGGLGIFSKWSGLNGHKNSTKNIESSLAAIFRGVAYGLSTTPTSTTSTTPPPPPPPPPPSTTSAVAPTTHSNGRRRRPPFSSPEWSGLEELLFQTFDEGPIEGYPDLLPDGANEADDALDVGVGVRQAAWVQALGVAWVVHVYCAAGLYSLLAVLAILWLSRMHSAQRLLPRGYYVTFHLLMLFVAVLRCLHLFHDPYGTKHRLPEALAVVMAEMGWPCLTGAIALVVMAVVHAWRFPPHVPLRHNAPVTLGIITVFHLLVSICTHLFAMMFPEHAGPLRAASRTATAAWGGVIGVGSFLAICRVSQAQQQQLQQQQQQQRQGQGHHTVMVTRVPATSTSTSSSSHHPRAVLIQAAHLTLVATFAQVVLAALHLYGLLGPHYVLQLPPSQPWHWLAFQSTCCLLELLAWVLLAVVSLLTVGESPAKRGARKGEVRLFSVLWCKHCRSCVSRGGRDNDVFHSVCHSSTQPVSSYTLQTCAKTVPHEGLRQPHPQRHVPQSLRKPPSFRPTAPDVHLLWSHGHTQDAPPSGCSSRPSSVVFSGTGLGGGAGLARFKKSMNAQTGGTPDVVQKSLQSTEPHVGKKESSFLQKATEKEPAAYDQPLYYGVSKGADRSPVKSAASPKFGSPYPDNRLEHLSQNHLVGSSELDSEDGQSRSEGMTDYSSTDALSLAVMGDNDCSKYTSTCSSISAANSFDVRMCDDFEVGYYQIPYSASPQLYSSVHQHSPLLHSTHHGTAQDAPAGMHGCEARQLEHFRSLQDSRTSSPASDQQGDYPGRPPSNVPARKSHPDIVAPASLSHSHPRAQSHVKLDSPRVQRPSPSSSSSVHKGHANPNTQGSSSLPVQGRAGETVSADEVLMASARADFSQNGCGNPTPEGAGVYAQPLKCNRGQQTHHRRRSAKGERIRPCGHRPRVKQDLPAGGNAVQAQERSVGDSPHHRQEEASTVDGTTQTDMNTMASTSSSRTGSSFDSDFPSDDVDSESEIPFETHSVEDRRRNDGAPALPPRRYELQRTAKAQGRDL